MIVKIDEKEYELKFTFNSYRYMEDFDVSELSEIERKPFKMIGVTQNLLLGALNSDPKHVVKMDVIRDYTEQIIEDGTIAEVMEALVTALEDSSFFKALQAKETPKPVKAKK